MGGTLLQGLANGVREQVKKPSWATKHITLLSAQFLFAGMQVFANPALEHIPPFVFATIRLFISLPFLYLATRQEGKVALTWTDYLHILFLGITGVAVPQSVIFVANELAGAGIVGMLMPLTGVFAALFSGVMHLERIGPLKGIGILVAVAGAVLIALADKSDFSERSPWGTVALLIALSSYGFFVNLLTLFLRRKPIPMTSYFGAVLCGFFLLIPISALELQSKPLHWDRIPYWAWLAELYCGMLITSGAHLIVAWVVQHCAAVLPTVYTCLASPITVAMAAFFLGESFHLADGGCLVLILLGLGIIVYVKTKESKEKDKLAVDGGKIRYSRVENEEKELLLGRVKGAQECKTIESSVQNENDNDNGTDLDATITDDDSEDYGAQQNISYDLEEMV